MKGARRTTIAADADDLATLEAEATRRGTALTTVIAEAIAEKATALRTRRRPRVGVARSTDGRTAAEVASEPVARPPR
ncbi:MAG TPA: hypothetical protein VG452_10955 [Egibacteraceae bacterium]|nr:hypothetical protein [Actinomycetota bacterium]HWB72726.1 hypothetical protein [Egibacteraceae bacterium]